MNSGRSKPTDTEEWLHLYFNGKLKIMNPLKIKPLKKNEVKPATRLLAK